jgi:hypothetical protein
LPRSTPHLVSAQVSLPSRVRDPHLHLRAVQVSVAGNRSLRVTCLCFSFSIMDVGEVLKEATLALSRRGVPSGECHGVFETSPIDEKWVRTQLGKSEAKRKRGS